jgi:4-hydroxybenzoate polyprenyltransferase
MKALPAYLGERFPPIAYGILVALFFGSATLVGNVVGEGTSVHWAGAAVVFLVFFHLRVFDEHKDYESDVLAYPDRVLSRGDITLRDLKILGGLALVLEGVLSAWIGERALIAWGVTLVFTLLMAKEFFIGSWLNKHIVVYAISHNPVVACLAVYSWACTDAAWSNIFIAYVAMVSLGSLAFEVGRKFRLPSEEVEGVESYTSALGRGTSMGFLWTVVHLTAVSLGVLLLLMGDMVWIAVLPVLPALFLIQPASSAKKVELGATLVLFLSMLISGIVAWV